MTDRPDDERHEAGEPMPQRGKAVVLPAETLEQRARALAGEAIEAAFGEARVDHELAPHLLPEKLASIMRAKLEANGLASGSGKVDPFEGRWHPLDLEWVEKPPPARDWLLKRPGDHGNGDASEGFFPSGKVGMLAAAGGIGKTMALVQLGLAVATGEPWLGHYAVPKGGRVLLALGEEDAIEVHRRLFNAAKVMWPNEDARTRAMSAAAQQIVVVPLAGAPVGFVKSDRKSGEVSDTEALKLFRERLDDGGEWRLIVLDPLSRFAGPDTETDNAAATRFVQAVESLASLPGNPAIMLAHHTTKSSRRGEEVVNATAARGASALSDGVRWVATLLQEKYEKLSPVVLELSKTNYTAQAPVHRVVREYGGALRALNPEERAMLEVARTEKSAKRAEKAKSGNGTAQPSPPSSAELYGE